MQLSNDMILLLLTYLHIYDVFAFIRTNKHFWTLKDIHTIFKLYYPNPDIALIDLPRKENCLNMRTLFISLFTIHRKYKGIAIEEIIKFKNVDILNKLIARGHMSYWNDINFEKRILMNLPAKDLRSIEWIFTDESYSEEKDNEMTGIGYVPILCGTIGGINQNPFNCNNIIILGTGIATSDGQVVIGSYEHPVKLIDGNYIRVSVNGRVGKLPIIFDD